MDLPIKKKKAFSLTGLFRSRSDSYQANPNRQTNAHSQPNDARYGRRVSDGAGPPPRAHRIERIDEEDESVPRRHPRHREHRRREESKSTGAVAVAGNATGRTKSKGKGREPEPGPLTEWPPSGVSSQEDLTIGQAMVLVSRGVPAHKGHKRPIPHATDSHFSLCSTTAGNRGDDTDAANLHDAMVQLATLKIHGQGRPVYPWETLEQPSFAFRFGARPGTVTLNGWVAQSSVIPPYIALRDPGMAIRPASLTSILERLKVLQAGLGENDDPDRMYQLYEQFLQDPENISDSRKGVERQITDLVMALSASNWVDYTIPKNQVVTTFIFDAEDTQYRNFFYQLLLSLELELRIDSRSHQDRAKERLMNQIPPKIQWDLALARRWKDNVRVDECSDAAVDVRLRFKLRKRQAKMLKRFAQMMKWPNLPDTLAELKKMDEDGSLVSISSHTMAFFSGIVLPGPTFPFLIMNALVDVDPSQSTDDLALLTHLHPNCGFQYRSSYTYWTSSSIVGKVLAPTCHELAGWVGPARPTKDLRRCEIARINARRPSPSQRISPESVTSMSERSDPLGPPAESYPVDDYELLRPNTDEDAAVDTVRIELLNLRPLTETPAKSKRTPETRPRPRWFDASLQFAIDGRSWPLRLAYDVSFVSAWPCSSGPHPLFFDYAFTSVPADEVVRVRNWGRKGGASKPGSRGTGGHPGVSFLELGNDSFRSSTPGTPRESQSREPIIPPATTAATGIMETMPGQEDGEATERPKDEGDKGDDEDDEKVLVVEAFGVKDNEVLARAWCAHWGLSAVVADVNKTCMACAIREAYAATIKVVILVKELKPDTE